MLGRLLVGYDSDLRRAGNQAGRAEPGAAPAWAEAPAELGMVSGPPAAGNPPVTNSEGLTGQDGTQLVRGTGRVLGKGGFQIGPLRRGRISGQLALERSVIGISAGRNQQGVHEEPESGDGNRAPQAVVAQHETGRCEHYAGQQGPPAGAQADNREQRGNPDPPADQPGTHEPGRPRGPVTVG